MIPFKYPVTPHVRRHGPKGYAAYPSYRPWLRDEFRFRCIFCLLREQWGRATNQFDLDHFLPTAQFFQEQKHYENLLYSCSRCNEAKADKVIPDPCEALVESALVVHSDGTIETYTSDAKLIVRALRLNDRESIEFRRMWMRIVATAEAYDPALYQRLLAYPDDLPDLTRLRPPGGNSRPEGASSCYYVQRCNGTLPPCY